MFTAFILGLVYFLSALVIAILTIYLCFRVVSRLTHYDDAALLNEGNIAVSLVLTGAFIAMAVMVKNALYPVAAVMQDFALLADKSGAQLIILLLRSAGYILITVILALLSIAAALSIFKWLTHDMDEDAQIRQNNAAVGLLLAGVLVAFALMIESGIGSLVNTLIPIQEVLDR